MSRRKSISFEDFFNPDLLASDIANKYWFWESQRASWLSLTKETRDYIFATDTRTTTAGSLGWKNSTHLPKLCQIRDNLHANYMAAVFPNDRAISFEADSKESMEGRKGASVEAYMRNKLRLSGFRTEVQKCLLDWIDYGNCFAKVNFVNEQHEDPVSGAISKGYVGPEMERISPLDIVFDPTAVNFLRTPKIIRELTTLSDLAIQVEDYPDDGYIENIFKAIKDSREKFMTAGAGMGMDVKKNDAYRADGFSAFRDYFESDYVELLHYYGDIYDKGSETLLRNQHIVIADRMYVLRQDTHPGWSGMPPIFHAGWRVRPDNLYAMGPLDNLVGLQYRIDHLENAKADALDMIVHPVLKIRGWVEDFNYGPNERVYVGDEGDVEFMSPDATVLSLNTEISQIMQTMEELAGAPRQAMGFRTPGEKTAFEVQILENGANRVFLNKTSHFEIIFLEPLLNCMLQTSRRHFGDSEDIRIEDSDFNFVQFLTVTKSDLLATGNIRSLGARRFANKANLLQNLTQYANTPLGQDPEIMQHFSAYKMARLVEDLLEINEYSVVDKNVRIVERADAAQDEMAAQEMIMNQQTARGNMNAGEVPQQPAGTQGPRQ